MAFSFFLLMFITPRLCVFATNGKRMQKSMMKPELCTSFLVLAFTQDRASKIQKNASGRNDKTGGDINFSAITA
uniref:Secreted protein n=1 Tax=Globodera rostochiensis TaxID=31243 RepID=A0A914GQT4_GLORO